MSETVWLFDLDNTLHNADAGIFQLINTSMTNYMAGRLNLPREQASQLRQDYWHRYGATLAGLQIHHPEIDIGEFLRECHPLPQILSKLTPMVGTHEALGRLKGHKAVFSNGPSFYVRALTDAMGITPYFELLAGTEDFDLLYKPNPQAYLTVCRLLRTTPANCIMIDDSADNLHAAKALGMGTVWFGQKSHDLPFVDFAAHDMAVLGAWAAKNHTKADDLPSEIHYNKPQ
ncbi:pyrimidine 5'-nucleotidase [Neisseria perflava]|uniref:pyrimidine 5'-nucleotidase n=1 Tax=Neisseria perflava TaxID=33053 RepID=UPI0020A15301|nr:pyrimidine 5'-nucleotidase [Neisseria perflava]MCP1660106.1 putative hydrolase of the HAD superfamily [Neisseria perflava]MCP1772760.1 putative hydrolase of the HAD superfamily [Neisseria perflava]